MNHTDTIKAFAAAFTTGTRADGTEFVRLADGTPEWMTDIVHAAHGDMLPDDTRYRMISECADALAEREPEEWQDAQTEIADSLVDVYNADRTRWLASRLDRANYVDQAREDGLIGPAASLFDQLGVGQFAEYEEILATIIEEVNSRTEEEEA